MSELAIGGPNASDIFAMAGDFKAQSSSRDDKLNIVYALDANGDANVTDTHGSMHDVTCEYVYVGSAKLWDTAGADVLPKAGVIKGSMMITSITVAYSNTARPKVSITGHNHTANAHDANLATFSPSINLDGGFGVPALFANSVAASACKSASYTLSCEHVDADGATGNHLAGATYNGKEELTMEFVGTPGLTVPSGWSLSSLAFADSNSEFDTNSFSYERPIVRD